MSLPAHPGPEPGPIPDPAPEPIPESGPTPEAAPEPIPEWGPTPEDAPVSAPGLDLGDPAADPEASALPGTADAEGWRRMHPLSPLLRGGLALLVIAGIIIANFRDRIVELLFAGSLLAESDPGADSSEVFDETDLLDFVIERGLLVVVLGGALVVILLIVAASWVMWRFTTYRLAEEAVETRSGVLFRNHRRAPLERIQSVNLQRPLLARALGLTKIQIQTGGQGGTVELAYLSSADAKTVREQILRRAAEKRNGPSPVEAQPAAPGDPAVPVPDAGLSAALTERATVFIDADIDAEALASNTLVRVPVGRLLGSIALSWEAAWLLAIVAAIVFGSAIFSVFFILGVVPMLVVMAGVMFGQFNKGFRFTLSRGRDTVRTGAGLTSTTTETIPFGRIHAVEARQPLFWRPFGWWRVRITTAGQALSEGGLNVVLPVGPEEDVLRVLDTLLPGIGDDAAEIAALRNGLSGPGAGYLGAGRRAGWVLWWGRRRAGIALDGLDSEDATLRIRRGVLTRSLSIMPIVRAQSVQLRRPLMHRPLGLASLQAHTVLGPVRMEMRGLDLAAARTTFDAIAAAVLRIQGAEAHRIGAAHDAHAAGEARGAAAAQLPAGAPAQPEADPAPIARHAADPEVGR